MAQTISIIDVILAKALAISASKAYTDQKTQSLMGGVHYRGQVDYYDNLPNDPEEGDSYTVRYAGSSGTVADGTEYTWGVDSSTNTMTWISFSKDAYSKAETDLLLAAKQSLIDAANKLDGSLVGPLTGYVAAVTAAALDPTDTLLQALGKLEKAADDNKNNILLVANQSVNYNVFDIANTNVTPSVGASVVKTNKTITVTSTSGNNYAHGEIYIQNFKAGTYYFSCKVDSLIGQDEKHILVRETIPAGNLLLNLIVSATGTIYGEFTVSSDITLFIGIYTCYTSNSDDEISISDIAIIPKTVYDAGFTDYQPYALSNAELTAAEKQNENNILTLEQLNGSKNLLNISLSGQGSGGNATCTDNGDGSITITPAAGIGAFTVKLADNMGLPVGDYVLSINTPIGANNYITARYTGGQQAITGNDLNLTLTNKDVTQIYLYLESPIQVTLKPMLCTRQAWDMSHQYMPYAPSNRELYEMIKALQT